MITQHRHCTVLSEVGWQGGEGEVSRVSRHRGQGDPRHEPRLPQLLRPLVPRLRLLRVTVTLLLRLQLPLPGGCEEVEAGVEHGQRDLPDLELPVEALQGADLREAAALQLLTRLLHLLYARREGADSPSRFLKIGVLGGPFVYLSNKLSVYCTLI